MGECSLPSEVRRESIWMNVHFLLKCDESIWMNFLSHAEDYELSLVVEEFDDAWSVDKIFLSL